MMFRIVVSAAVLAACSTLAPQTAASQGYDSSFDAGEAREAVKTGRTVPLAKIRQDLKRRHGGNMTDADLYSRGNGGSEYKIKWIDRDGQRLIITVDAQTGRVLQQSRG